MEHKKSENIKLFLDNKLKDCEVKIKKLKRKRRIVKTIYGILIIISVTASTAAVAVSGSFALPLLPAVIIASLSSVGQTTVAFTTCFGSEEGMIKLINTER